jgi:hypothetical protein
MSDEKPAPTLADRLHRDASLQQIAAFNMMTARLQSRERISSIKKRDLHSPILAADRSETARAREKTAREKPVSGFSGSNE